MLTFDLIQQSMLRRSNGAAIMQTYRTALSGGNRLFPDRLGELVRCTPGTRQGRPHRDRSLCRPGGQGPGDTVTLPS
jgi:hypothetical protein